MITAKKNAAYYLSFSAIDSTTPASYKSGISPVDTAYSKDGAGVWTALAITDTASEIGTTGVYEIDLTAAEMNHDKVMIKFAVSGMADDAYLFDLQTKLVDDLQDITTAQVNTECDTALADYDGPTNAEMNARTLLAANYFDPAVDAVANVTLVATTTNLTNNTPEATVSAATANQIADHIIRRSWANVEASSDGDTIAFRSLLGAVAKLVNKVAISGADLQIFRDDDTTVLGTQALTTDSGAEPITGMDTA